MIFFTQSQQRKNDLVVRPGFVSDSEKTKRLLGEEVFAEDVMEFRAPAKDNLEAEIEEAEVGFPTEKSAMLSSPSEHLEVSVISYQLLSREDVEVL